MYASFRKKNINLLGLSNHIYNIQTGVYDDVVDQNGNKLDFAKQKSYFKDGDVSRAGTKEDGTMIYELTENGKNTVLILEAGGKDRNFFIHMPSGYSQIVPTKSNLNYAFETEPESTTSNRKLYWPRGRGWGGSSSINAMIYIRGHAHDYDLWRQMGNSGWSYDDVLPYFKKAESFNGDGDKDYHGFDGPLNVKKSERTDDELLDVYVEAGKQAGFPITKDFNGENQEGIGFYQCTQKNGKRCSTAKAYLVPILDRDNLTVMTDTNINRIIIENNKAVGVECINKDGKYFTVNTNKEVLLSSGAFGSPQIMLRSGIGPAEEILKHDIEHQHDLPGVGKNLQDHIDYLTVHRYNSMELIGMSLKSIFFKFPFEILKYIFAKTGLFTSTIAEAGGFIKSNEEKDIQDIQLHFIPTMVVDHGRTQLWGHGLGCHMCLLRPRSRGEVTLNSSDPFEDPNIDPKFLSHPDDMQDMIAGYKQMMAILNKESFSKYTSCLLYTSPSPRDRTRSRMPSSA